MFAPIVYFSLVLFNKLFPVSPPLLSFILIALVLPGLRFVSKPTKDWGPAAPINEGAPYPLPGPSMALTPPPISL